MVVIASLFLVIAFFAFSGSINIWSVEEENGLTGRSSGQMIFDVMLRLIIVIGLIYLSLFLLKSWQSKKRIGIINRRMNLNESLRLSPRQAVHLIQIGEQELLIGSTDQSVNLLAEVTNKDEILGEAEIADPEPADFRSVIHKVLNGSLNQRSRRNSPHQTENEDE